MTNPNGLINGDSTGPDHAAEARFYRLIRGIQNGGTLPEPADWWTPAEWERAARFFAGTLSFVNSIHGYEPQGSGRVREPRDAA